MGTHVAEDAGAELPLPPEADVPALLVDGAEELMPVLLVLELPGVDVAVEVPADVPPTLVTAEVPLAGPVDVPAAEEAAEDDGSWALLEPSTNEDVATLEDDGALVPGPDRLVVLVAALLFAALEEVVAAPPEDVDASVPPVAVHWHQMQLDRTTVTRRRCILFPLRLLQTMTLHPQTTACTRVLQQHSR